MATEMEYRQLGGSGFKVPALCLGTGTFGGSNEFFKAWGTTGVEEATRLVDICLEAGLNFFDSADIYSDGQAEEVLGGAIKGRRDQVLISTKATFRSGEGPNDVGSSRWHLIQAVEGSLRRLGTDYIDLFQLHGFDALTPIEETLGTLDDLVRAGKIRYLGCSNFSGWHLMKSLAISEKHGLDRYVAHQAYYSLVGREFEWELMPLALDQGVGTVVWSPLGWGRLTGKIRRGQPSARNQPPAKRSRRRMRAHLSPTITSTRLLTRSTPLPPKPAKPSRKSRSTGCSSGRVFPLSSSAPATKNSCVKTSAPSAGALRLSRSQSSMLPAPRPPSIRTGTSKASPSATLSRHHRVLLTATATRSRARGSAVGAPPPQQRVLR